MPLFTVTMKSNGSTNKKTAFPELSMLQALLLDIQRTTFSNFSFRWDQATSGLICTIPHCPSRAPPNVDDWRCWLGVFGTEEPLEEMSAVHPIAGLDARRRSPMQLHGCFRTDHLITRDSP